MKKIVFALVGSAIVSAAALGASSAFAADDVGSSYFGVGVLASRYNFDVSSASSVDNHSGYKAGAKIYGGYNFDQTWAAEIGYADFGNKSYNYTVGTGLGYMHSDAHSYYAAGKGTWPVNQQVALFGKLGVARNHNDVETSGIAAVSGGKDKTALYASVGAEYAINKNVKVSLEYENYGKNEIDQGRKTGAVTAGLRYNF